jgi:uncharacterized protein YbjT (DUF2867 family)
MDQSQTDGAAPILVTGGTGVLGRLVVARLRAAGRTVRVLSRGRKTREERPGVEFVDADLALENGVDRAVRGAEILLHLAGSAKGDADKAHHLMTAAARSRVHHVVFISVVGADRIPQSSPIDRAMFGYFGAKLAAERIIAGSAVPSTTLRATQFHEAMLMTIQQMAKLPFVVMPGGFRFQPIAADEVAARLVELALGAPSGRVPDMGGPRIYAMSELARAYLRAVGRRRPIIAFPMMGKAAGAFRAGANLTPDRAVGRSTWEEFLSTRVGQPTVHEGEARCEPSTPTGEPS